MIEAFEATPTTFATRIWATDKFPSDNTDERDDAELLESFASVNGTTFYIVDWAPHSEIPDHRTLSIDFGVVFSGEAEKLLENKVAIITGAASGIGLASAETFVANGARVVLVDIQDEAGKAAADRLGPTPAFAPWT